MSIVVQSNDVLFYDDPIRITPLFVVCATIYISEGEVKISKYIPIILIEQVMNLYLSVFKDELIQNEENQLYSLLYHFWWGQVWAIVGQLLSYLPILCDVELASFDGPN